MKHFTLAAGLLTCIAALPVHADDGPPPLAGSHVTFDDLSAYGSRLLQVEEYRDNAFLYEQAMHEARVYADSLPGAELRWRVRVERVTFSEVLVQTDNPKQVLLAILPGPAAHEPDSLHATHWYYNGPPSTQVANIISEPDTLRIGYAIPLEIARRLRKGDIIEIAGRIDRIHPPEFSGQLFGNVAYIADVRFVAIPDDE